ncbi:PqqD family protein [uncultured Jatrophihabitans sp.]|uniref:PqqD family protein n=1 Tax=uncultured Jatrophihabitans sp. TaxID=1610747 RepID=UPI0035CACABA
MIERVPDLMSTPVNEDMVFLNPDSDNYVAIDAIGRRIWEILEHPVRFGDLVDSLAAEFDGARAQIEDDTAAFLGELQREGMVRVVEPG